jgi:hypothetical protein
MSVNRNVTVPEVVPTDEFSLEALSSTTAVANSSGNEFPAADSYFTLVKLRAYSLPTRARNRANSANR